MEENPQFDRVKAGIDGIVEYAERLETMEQVYKGWSQNGEGKKTKSRGGKPKSDQAKGKSGSESGEHTWYGGSQRKSKDCMIHGPNCGHSTDECKVLIDHAGKVKAQFQARHPSKKHPILRRGTGYKPWKKEEDKTVKVYSAKEVQMLLQKQKNNNRGENYHLENDKKPSPEEKARMEEGIHDTNAELTEAELDNELAELMKDVE